MVSSDLHREAVAAALEAMCSSGGDLSVQSRRATVNLYGASPARLRVWNAIIEEFLDDESVPREGRAAVVTAGPPGSGKSTQLEAALAGDLGAWRRLDADAIKEHLIRREVEQQTYEDLLDQVLADGRPLMPLELAGLVHEESVQILADLRRLCMQRGENVIVEGTLSWSPQVDVHLREIAEHGYETLDVMVVDVARNVALEQALSRWWTARCDLDASLGGRFVPQGAIDACYRDDGGTTCRANAEELVRKAYRLGGLSVRALEPSQIAKDGQSLRVVGDD